MNQISKYVIVHKIALYVAPDTIFCLMFSIPHIDNLSILKGIKNKIAVNISKKIKITVSLLIFFCLRNLFNFFNFYYIQ